MYPSGKTPPLLIQLLKQEPSVLVDCMTLRPHVVRAALFACCGCRNIRGLHMLLDVSTASGCAVVTVLRHFPGSQLFWSSSHILLQHSLYHASRHHCHDHMRYMCTTPTPGTGTPIRRFTWLCAKAVYASTEVTWLHYAAAAIKLPWHLQQKRLQ